MNIRPIETEADYDWALAESEKYFISEPPPGSKEASRFQVLLALIENYEARAWKIPPMDPIDAIKIRMEMLQKTQQDLAELVGSKSRASELLSRKRPLTMKMAAKLNKEWQIPAETLLQANQRSQQR